MRKGYQHHFFISYSRSGDVPDWLDNHFLPVLTNRLIAVMDENPKIFVDKRIETGSDWPEVLANALRRSCYMVAIWTPHYFRSRWCLAEWESMRFRERQLKTLSTSTKKGLVY